MIDGKIGKMPRLGAKKRPRTNDEGGEVILEEEHIEKLSVYLFVSSTGGQISFVRAADALTNAVKEWGRNVDAVRSGVDGVHATLTECKSAREAEEKSRKRRKRKRKASTSSNASVDSRRDAGGLDILTPVVIQVSHLSISIVELSSFRNLIASDGQVQEPPAERRGVQTCVQVLQRECSE